MFCAAVEQSGDCTDHCFSSLEAFRSCLITSYAEVSKYDSFQSRDTYLSIIGKFALKNIHNQPSVSSGVSSGIHRYQNPQTLKSHTVVGNTVGLVRIS